MNRVEIAVSGSRRPSWAAALKGFFLAVLEAIDAEGWEVSVLLCDDQTMRGLNRKYRKRDRPTDVLSFRQADEESPGIAALAGDVVISLDTMERNARALRIPLEEELKRLAVHGLLHLSGMDHGRGKGNAMRSLEQRLLAGLASMRVMAATKERVSS